jgi:transaldolase
MPEPTLRAFRDHGTVALTLEHGLEEAQRLLEQLADAGIDYDDVVQTLETEGIQKFCSAYSALLAGLEAKDQTLMTTSATGVLR